MMGRRSHAPAAPSLDAITPRVRSELRDGQGPAMVSAGHDDRREDRAEVAKREGRSVPDRPVRIDARVSGLDLDSLPAGSSEGIGKLTVLLPDLPKLHDPFVGYEAEVAIDGLAGPNHVRLAIAFHADFGERLAPDLARNVEEGHVARTLTA